MDRLLPSEGIRQMRPISFSRFDTCCNNLERMIDFLEARRVNKHNIKQMENSIDNLIELVFKGGLDY